LIADTTRSGGPDFVPIAERIATFDNDGTLWTEHPMYVEVLFARSDQGDGREQPSWRTNNRSRR
jgi:hypothetical protein